MSDLRELLRIPLLGTCVNSRCGARLFDGVEAPQVLQDTLANLAVLVAVAFDKLVVTVLAPALADYLLPHIRHRLTPSQPAARYAPLHLFAEFVNASRRDTGTRRTRDQMSNPSS